MEMAFGGAACYVLSHPAFLLPTHPRISPARLSGVLDRFLVWIPGIVRASGQVRHSCVTAAALELHSANRFVLHTMIVYQFQTFAQGPTEGL